MLTPKSDATLSAVAPPLMPLLQVSSFSNAIFNSVNERYIHGVFYEVPAFNYQGSYASIKTFLSTYLLC